MKYVTKERISARKGLLSLAWLGGLAAAAAVISLSTPSSAPAGEQSAGPKRASISAEALTSYYRQTIAFWSRHLERDPHSAIAVRQIARARLGLARATGDEQQYLQAERELRRPGLLERGDDTAGQVLLGRALMAQHKFGEALAAAERASERKPDYNALELKGDALYAVGRYREAFAAYKKLHEMQPGYSSLSRLADMHEMRGERVLALKLFKQARDSYEGAEPEPAAWIRLRIGILHLRAQELEQAEHHFRESLAAAPNYYLAQEHLAEVHELRGEWAEALPLLERAIAVHPAPALLLRSAELLTEAGRSEEASVLRERAAAELRAAAEDGSESHLRDYAEYLLAGDRAAEALPLLERDYRIRPGDLRANLLLARAHRMLGDAEAARKHISAALRLGTRHTEYFEEAAQIKKML